MIFLLQRTRQTYYGLRYRFAIWKINRRMRRAKAKLAKTLRPSLKAWAKAAIELMDMVEEERALTVADYRRREFGE